MQELPPVVDVQKQYPVVVDDSDRCVDDVADLLRVEQAMAGGDSPAGVSKLAERFLVHQLASPSRLICPST